MKPTPATRAVLHPTGPVHSMLKKTTPTQNWKHYNIAYMRIHDHQISEVSPPGMENPREKYIWRRAWTFMVGKQRFLIRDNVYQEEQPVAFQDPVPGGHGDRFSHSWDSRKFANYQIKEAQINWEKANLTPEQLAAKYGYYYPRPDQGIVVFSYLLYVGAWMFMILMSFYDKNMGVLTHPCLDDFIRENGGIRPLRAGEEFLEQWIHPRAHALPVRNQSPHWSYKPMQLENTKQYTNPL
eukprot:TRINITY_DN1182_c7_g1_i1.p1 TRINITY_DN1182_c7_g1~~TRINITY_DN1182_c7_g1_i1.p1  ORF type:complete len:239 (+),score=32.87 TRINITY_DN1182_c7_g1_i1:39-755(+)